MFSLEELIIKRGGSFMMKRLSIVFLVFGLIFIFSSFSFAARGVLVEPVDTNQVVVSQAGDGDYETIQEALDNAEEGSTILVRPGEYHENLYVEVSDIKLIGEGPEDVKVISSKGENALSVSDVSNVEVKGFTFIYSPPENDKGNACVWIADSDHILFHDNIIKGATFSGLELSNVNFSKVYDNLFTDNKQSGIFVNTGAEDLLIYKNKSFKNGYHGIEISEEGSSPFVFNNTLKENAQSGIYIHDSATPIIKYNDILENKHSGIAISKEALPLIVDNNISKNKEDGIYGYDNARAKILSNTINNNGISGISFSNAYGVIMENTIKDNAQFGVDIYVEKKEELVPLDYKSLVAKNLITKNGYSGIGGGGELLKLTVFGNIIKSNKEDGILIYNGASVDVLHNLIMNSALNGIEVRKEARVNAINNTIVENDTGIYTHDNGYGTYTYNIVAFNKLGMRYKEDKEGNIMHTMNLYWKNEKLARDFEIGDENFVEDPGFEDTEKGNYYLKKDSKFRGWGY